MSTLNELRDARIKKLEELKTRGINPYPSRISLEGTQTTIAQARENMGQRTLVAGRIWSVRGHGAITFMDLRDESGKIQLLLKEEIIGTDNEIVTLIDSGDFIACAGTVTQTKTGEVSIEVSDLQMLSKSLRPLPVEWYGLKDTEERYRKRYLDLLLNPSVRERFNIRTKIVREIRSYLDGQGYWEVETPTLQTLYGGANAKPFKTHLNALDTDMYLRIADELYLKRLITGGYEKVYEICKDFRNEGVDQTHSPEFTMIEYYESYADYQKMMDVTEGLFKHLADRVLGQMKIKVGGREIDISQKWPRVTMVDEIKEKLGLDVEKEDQESLEKYCNENKVELLGGETKGQLVYTIFEHKVTDQLNGPIWIIDYPKDVSPLSKKHATKEGWVERFEGYIGGKEICDGWSELTDPMEQRSRFVSDEKLSREDKEEAQQVDEEFLEAMEYGMPPLGGIGIGIDRLTMFLTNTWLIKETILFPTLRPDLNKNLSLPSEEKYDYKEKKIVAILDTELPIGLAMNALGHMSFAMGNTSNEEWMGKEWFDDADGIKHHGISKYPFIVLKADKKRIKEIVNKAKNSALSVVDYPQEMFDTGKDQDLVKAINNAKSGELVYRAVTLSGVSKNVDKLTEDLELFK